MEHKEWTFFGTNNVKPQAVSTNFFPVFYFCEKKKKLGYFCLGQHRRRKEYFSISQRKPATLWAKLGPIVLRGVQGDCLSSNFSLHALIKNKGSNWLTYKRAPVVKFLKQHRKFNSPWNFFNVPEQRKRNKPEDTGGKPVWAEVGVAQMRFLGVTTLLQRNEKNSEESFKFSSPFHCTSMCIRSSHFSPILWKCISFCAKALCNVFSIDSNLLFVSTPAPNETYKRMHEKKKCAQNT